MVLILCHDQLPYTFVSAFTTGCTLYKPEACRVCYHTASRVIASGLRTHKYSYHSQKGPNQQEKLYSSPINSLDNKYEYKTPVRVQSPTESSTHDYGYDDLQDKVLDMEIEAIQMKADQDILQSSVDELEKLVRSIKAEMSQKANDLHYSPKDSRISSSQEFNELRSLVESNRNDITNLKDRMDYAAEQSDTLTEGKDEDDKELAAKDLLDDMSDTMSSFAHHKFEAVTDDIPKLRNVFKFILQTIDHGRLSEEQIELLNEISNASKSTARALVHRNFSHLANIFNQKKSDFEELIEPVDGDENSDFESQEVESNNEEGESVSEGDSEYHDTDIEIVENDSDTEEDKNSSSESINSETH